ncbi:hypothetical protein PVAND_004263 [Polypedilum vanderplanki]|uniref:Reverse transcriptase domain-containing protein n=1 Tax=Polypedilum vanderplanki TaxID=319348 RepID=A0A9J6BWL7_POLVA|nr:hypothetical protein PVAND_004263 [Polypedilum vanderplanki]
MSWNIRCFNREKLTNLKQYLDEMTRKIVSKNRLYNDSYNIERSNFIDVIVLLETWSTENDQFDTYKIKNYNNFSITRPKGKKGGGILIYIHKKFQAIKIDSMINGDIEFLLLKLIIEEECWFILGIYRKPQGDLERFLDCFEEIVAKVDVQRLIIAGDINVNILKACHKTSSYIDCIQSLNLKFNEAVTRDNMLFRSSGSLIDHCLISHDIDNYLAFTSTKITKMSDHNFVLLLLQLKTFSKRKVRLTKSILNETTAIDNINWALFNWNVDPHDGNVDFYWNSLYKTISKLIDDSTTKRTIRLPKNESTLPMWADKKYQSMLHTLNNLSDKIERFKLNGRPFDLLECKYKEMNSIRTEYGSIIAKLFYKRMSLRGNKEAWEIINELAGRKKEIQQLILITNNNEIIVNEAEIAQTFQSKFISIVGKPLNPIKSLRNKYFGPLVSKTFVFDEVSPLYINNVIHSLPNKKSTGLDNISTKVMKGISELFSIHLCNFFNIMVRTGKYPDRLKSSIIVPIYKGGNPTSADNYRPISLLSCVDKVLEKVIFGQMNEWMEKNHLHDNYQYGFRGRRGCQEAIAMALNIIGEALDTYGSVIVISFDISKAFDNVNLIILLRKLYFLGFRSTAHDLIESFLTSRRQTVKYKESLSDSEEIMRGVPQGSNGGPFLFTCMINDLQNLSTTSKLIKYADDLLLILPIETEILDEYRNVSNLEHDMNILYDYYDSNDLLLNYEKSNYTFIGKVKDTHLEAFMSDKGISKCESINYLGFELSSNVYFTDQINKVAKAMGNGLNALKHMKKELTISALKQFYFSHIFSRVSYCSFALMRAKSTDIDRLQHLQNKIIKVIYGLPKMFSTSELYKTVACDSLTIIGTIYLSLIVMVKKCIISNDDSLPDVHCFRPSARNSNVYVRKAKNRYLKRGIIHIGCNLYNQLPENIKQLHEVSLFKKHVRTYLLRHTDSLLRQGQFTHNKIAL